VLRWFNEDLSAAVLGAYDLPGASDDVAGGGNIYRENTDTGALQTLTRSEEDPIGQFDFLEGPVWGVARDDSHVALVTSTRLLAQAAPGVPNVYDWSNGSLRLAGILPDGSVPSAGSELQPSPNENTYRATISKDGSRIVFVSSATGNPQLYMRIDGSRTVWVSQSEGSIPVESPSEVQLQDVSEDASHILFTTTSKLLDSDTNEGSDLYMYTDGPDPEHEANLTQISNSGQVYDTLEGNPVVGMSEDGTKIYFQDDAARGLSVWSEGVVHLISPNVGRGGVAGTRISAVDSPGVARVSTDGNAMAFLSDGTREGDHVHGLTGEVTNEKVEMYAYDASTDRLKCVSCAPVGPTSAAATVEPHTTDGTASMVIGGLRPRFLTSDGKRVFFSTAESLVADDTNGVADVYEYNFERDRVSLVSSGSGVEGTYFADASPDGSDVFITTSQVLLGRDMDGLVDLYDARVNGGLPEPPRTTDPCSGDGCQGTLGSLPAPSVFGTFGIAGAGNEKIGATVQSRTLTRSQKLKRALRLCAKKSKRQRRRCVNQAHKRYGKSASKGGRGK
jgi:hypothetical protein